MAPSERDRRFVSYLEGLAGDGPPGALQDLAGEVPGGSATGRPSRTMIRSLRWLAHWVSHVSVAEQQRLHLVAALFAAHPARTDEGGANFGQSMACVARLRGLTPSLESRFVALLEADVEDVGMHLRRLVSLARAAEAPVDWARLLADLRRWDDPQRRVQAEWARAFWRAAGGAASAPATQPLQPSLSAMESEFDVQTCVTVETLDVGGTAPAPELCALVSEP